MTCVTIIIPLFNVELYVEQCLTSIKNQTYPSLQVICIDDASTDRTLDVARRCVAGDRRFQIIEQPRNMGQSAARNVGLKRATGDYVMFIDSDDYLEVDAVEVLVGRSVEQRLDILFYSARTIYQDADSKAMLQEDLQNRRSVDGVLTGEQLFCAFQKSPDLWCPIVLQVIRRSFIEEIGACFAEGMVHEDELFTATVLPQASRTAFLNECYYIRRIRQDSTMTAKSKIASIHGYYLVTSALRSWISDRADNYSEHFCRCFGENIFLLEQIAGRQSAQSNPEQLEAFLCSLPHTQQVDIESRIIALGRSIDRLEHNFIDSKAYKVGNALAFFPRAITKLIRKV